MTYTLEEGIAEITLDDRKANAFHNEWFAQFNELLDRTEAEEARALVLQGRPRIFSGGLNIKWLPTPDREQLRAAVETFGKTMLRVLGFGRPTIAELTGHAIGSAQIAATKKRLSGPEIERVSQFLVENP